MTRVSTHEALCTHGRVWASGLAGLGFWRGEISLFSGVLFGRHELCVMTGTALGV